MPTPRMPSQAQIRAQMRAAERKLNADLKTAARKAEREIEREMKLAERKAQSQLDRDLKKWERDTNRKLQAARPRVTYTTTERRYLTPIEEQTARQAVEHPERRDVFLCHAWADREGAALEVHDLLESYGVSSGQVLRGRTTIVGFNTRSRRSSYCSRWRRGASGGRVTTCPLTMTSFGRNCSAVRSSSVPSGSRFQ